MAARSTVSSATLQGSEPLTLVPDGATGPIPYPSDEIVTVNGIVEIIEHRRMGPVFYMTDEPDIKRKLGARPQILK